MTDTKRCETIGNLQQQIQQLTAQVGEMTKQLAAFNTIAIDESGTPLAAASAWRSECVRIMKKFGEQDTQLTTLREALEALLRHIETIEYRDKAQLRLGEAVPVFERAKHALGGSKEE